MTEITPEEQSVGAIRQHVRGALSQYDLTNFTGEAVEQVAASVGDHLKDVLNISTRAARRDALETVNVKHVRHALEQVAVSNRQARYQFWGNLGGVCLGTALANVWPIVEGVASVFTICGTIVLVAIGSGLVVLQAAKT